MNFEESPKGIIKPGTVKQRIEEYEKLNIKNKNEKVADPNNKIKTELVKQRVRDLENSKSSNKTANLENIPTTGLAQQRAHDLQNPNTELEKYRGTLTTHQTRQLSEPEKKFKMNVELSFGVKTMETVARLLRDSTINLDGIQAEELPSQNHSKLLSNTKISSIDELSDIDSNSSKHSSALEETFKKLTETAHDKQLERRVTADEISRDMAKLHRDSMALLSTKKTNRSLNHSSIRNQEPNTSKSLGNQEALGSPEKLKFNTDSKKLNGLGIEEGLVKKRIAYYEALANLAEPDPKIKPSLTKVEKVSAFINNSVSSSNNKKSTTMKSAASTPEIAPKPLPKATTTTRNVGDISMNKDTSSSTTGIPTPPPMPSSLHNVSLPNMPDALKNCPPQKSGTDNPSFSDKIKNNHTTKCNTGIRR